MCSFKRGQYSLVVEHLSTICKTLGSIPGTTKEKMYYVFLVRVSIAASRHRDQRQRQRGEKGLLGLYFNIGVQH